MLTWDPFMVVRNITYVLAIAEDREDTPRRPAKFWFITAMARSPLLLIGGRGNL
jgi:hypothetical protein